ncbi:hypothetical protein WN944_005922 [Citrus x changshan-huyou]|uniref:Uncharacterized protein n=1 Tax=Citrus x changshan-huyou TaxID=2935761 RepID=A0AAP0MN25_9ROSI
MNFRARKLGHRGIVTGEALQISPANDPCGSPAKEQQAAGVGIILQIMMLVLSFVLGHVLRRHKFYYLPEASASLLIGLIVGALANISNTETNISCSSATCLVMILFSWQKPFFSNFGAIVTFAIFGTFLASMVTIIPMAISLYRAMSLVRSHASSGQNFFMVIVRFLETFVGSMFADAENFQIYQRDGTCTAGCVLQEKEGLLELVEKGKIAARTEKSGQNASIDGCSHRDENPVVGAHKKCDRELFLLIFQDM